MTERPYSLALCEQMLTQASSWYEYHTWLHDLREAHWRAMLKPIGARSNQHGYPSFSSNPNDYSRWHFRQWQTCNNLINGVSWP